MDTLTRSAIGYDSVLRPGLQVLFMDDFTRCGVNGMHHSPENRSWLRGVLAPSLTASGCSHHDWRHDGHSTDLSEFMSMLGLPKSPAGWAATSLVAPLPDQAAVWLDSRLQGVGLVIGFELPLFLLRHFYRRGIDFMDVAIDPLRFARDLFFRVRTNNPSIERRLSDVEIDQDVLRTDAALLAAHARRHHPAILMDPAADVTVFFGQTATDRAVVVDGRISDPRLSIDAIGNAAGDDVLLIRPHPFETDHTITKDLLRLLPRARLTLANSYALLASDQVRRVVSLSSSLMAEAEFFGKEAVQLIHPDVDRLMLQQNTCSRWYRLDTTMASPGFWSRTLRPQPLVPNLLRDSLGSRWARELPLRPDTSLPSRQKPVTRKRRIARAALNLIRAIVT